MKKNENKFSKGFQLKEITKKTNKINNKKRIRGERKYKSEN